MATVNSPQSSSPEKVSGAVRVIMPDQTGSFQVNSTRGAVQKVQVVDVDMVLHMADGTKVVLAGGAMEAMDDKSKVKFSDTSADTGKLLDTVGKIPLAPNDQSRVLNSDPIAAADRTASSDVDPKDLQHVASDRNSAPVHTDSASQLAKIISENSGSLTSSSSQNPFAQAKPISESSQATASASTSQGTNDSPVKQIEPQLPPERPGTIPSTHVVGPSAPTIAVKLVNLTTVTQSGNTLYGSGGTPQSATDAALPIQFATQVINAGDDVRTIYAVGNNQNLFTKVFNVAISGDGTVLTMTVAGVPAGMSVVNGTSLGNGAYQITVAAGQKEFNLQLQYSTAIADSASPVHQTFDLTFTTSIATSDGVLSLTDTRHVAVKDAASYNDLIYLDPATGDSVLVLPAQGIPHEVHAGNGGVTIYGSNANDFLYGGTGNDIMIGGSGNTYFEGGAGADIITGGVGGINTVGYVNSTSGVTVNLVTGAGTRGDAEGDQLTNIQNVKGSSYDDIIIANAAANRIDGGAGGSDTVSYQESTSAVTVNLITASGAGGFAEGDVYAHIQNVIGSQYNDLFIANGEANRFDGGGGSDTVSYANSSAGVTVNLLAGTGSGGAAQGDTYVRIQNVIGSAYDDVFVGNADANAFDGGSGGNDTVSYAGSSTGVQVNFVSGRGTGGNAEGDTYIKIQNVIGSSYDDVFVAGIDSKHFDGGAGGSDTVNYGGSTGAVTVNMITMTGTGGYAQGNTYTNIQNIVGSSYSDTFIASAAANNFNGGLGGSDTVSYAFSNAGVTVDLYNGTGSGGYAQGDVLAHIQNVIGGDYDDLFIASADANSFVGGGGSNTVSYQYSTGAVTIDLTNTIGSGTGGAYAAGDTFSGIQNIIGSVYDDLFIASADANRFDGGGSSVHNRVSYAASNAGVIVDLNYTDGTGTSGGYAEGDQLVNIQDLTGSNFDDTFVASAATNSFDGGAGSNRVSYAASTAGVTVDLVDGKGTGGYAQGDTYVNIQNVTGSDGDDTFIASNQVNNFVGGLGSNTVSYAKASDATGVTVDLLQQKGFNGFAAGDTYSDVQNVIGTAYNDTFLASAVANAFDGHGGSDTVSYVYSTAGVTVNLATGAGSGGWAAGDTYANIQNIIGSQYDDLFVASADVNTIDGGINGKTDGTAARNRVSYAGSNAAVTVDLSTTVGTGRGGWAEGDRLTNIQDVTGSVYNDTFVASAATNYFDGGANNPDGTAPHNRVSYAASNAAVTIDLSTTIGTGQGGWAEGDQLTNIQDLTGSVYNDTFIASAVANYFDGGANNPDGSDAHNRVVYAASNAAVQIDLSNGTGAGGWAAGDTFTNIQDVTGSMYNDEFVASAAKNAFDGGVNNTDGSDPHNRVNYRNSNAAVVVDLAAGTGSGGWAAGDTYANIQDVTGSMYNDEFVASAAKNFFDGGINNSDNTDPHNRVNYRASNAAVVVDLSTTLGTGSGGWAAGDTYTNIQDVTGSMYNDEFIASAAKNFFDGGINNTDGSDPHNRVNYRASNTAVVVDLAAGTGSGGWAEGDTFTNIQDVTGSMYNDEFVASAAKNAFDGGVNNTDGTDPHNRVNYRNSNAAVVVDLAAGTGSGGWAAGDTYTNIQDVTGSMYNDEFIASGAKNFFDGGVNNTDGSDPHNRVNYRGSNAAVVVDLAAGTGVGGWASGDTYANIQDVTGSMYNDEFIASAAKNAFDGGVNNTDGSDPHNRVNYRNSNAAVVVDLSTPMGTGTGGWAEGDTFSNIQDVTGSQYNDEFIASAAKNAFDGGVNNSDGSDPHNRVNYRASNAAVVVDLAAGTGSGGWAAGDTYANIQDVTGSMYNDEFVASGAKNFFDGGINNTDGSDPHNRVNYRNSNAAVVVDLLAGTGSGGWADGDTYANIQDVTGSMYNDEFIASDAKNFFDGGVNNTDGSDPHNRVNYKNSNAAVVVDLSTPVGTGSGGWAAGDTYTNIQDVTGSMYDDEFVASAAKNRFDGGINNTDGSDPHNRVNYSVSTGAVTVNLSNGTGAGGWADGDTYANIQDVTGSMYNDEFVASAAKNRFDGGINNTDGSDPHNRVNYRDSNAGVVVNLITGAGSGGWADGDTYTNIQDVTGSMYNDEFIANAAKNRFDGGINNTDGSDPHNRVNYSSSTAAITVNLANGTGVGGWADGDTYTNIQDVTGSMYNDEFVASAAKNRFDGGVNNTDGSDPHNRVNYNTSNAAVIVNLSNGTGVGGWADGDTYANIQDVTGSMYNDEFVASAAKNRFDGGINNTDGSDPHNRVNYRDSNAAVVVNLITGTGSGGWADGDTYTNIQDVTGSMYNDEFIANAAKNFFDGGINNTDGSDPHNRVNYSSSTGAVTVNLASGAGTGGWAAGDTYTNIQDVTGSMYNDEFVASAAKNAFDGGINNTDGSDPHNRVNYNTSNAAVTVDLSSGTGSGGWATGDTYTNIQDVTGSMYDDEFIASAAKNAFNGGINNTDGSDPHNRVNYVNSTGAVTVNLTSGTGSGGWAAGDTYTNIQDVTGSQYDDIFIANAAKNRFDGGVNNSDGSDPHNLVSYACSTAAVSVDLSLGTGSGGWAAGDTYVRIQDVIGSQYNDEFVASGDKNNFDGGANMSGLTAHNKVNYRDSNAAVVVDLSTTVGTGSGGWAAGDTYTNIQDVTGSQYNDTFIASAAANNFDGGANMTGLTAHNRVSYQFSNVGVTVDLSTGAGSGGWASNDTYVNIQDATGAGVGNSTFVASAAANFFDGFLYNNTVSYVNGTVGGVNVDLSGAGMTGSGSGNWAAGDVYSNIQHAVGSIYDDRLTGVSVAGVRSVLLGGLGGDTIVGIDSNREFTYASYSTSTTGVLIDLSNQTGAAVAGVNEATGDILINISNVIGGSGNDIFIASNQSNKFEGGAGLDTVSYVNSNIGVTVNLTSGNGTNGWADGDNYISIENVIGSNFNDVLTGSSVAGTRSWLNGGTGNDTLVADAGNRGNTYANYAGQSAAVIVHLDTQLTEKASGAQDTLLLIDNVIGSGRADLYYASAAANKFEANGGNVTVSYANQTFAVTNGSVTNLGVWVDLTNGINGNGTAVTGGTGTKYGWAAGDVYDSVRNVIGTGFDDTFFASSAANRFDGGSGGSDTVDYSRSNGAVTVDLLAGTGAQGFATNDTYFNISNVVGSSYDDKFFGDSHVNTFTGGGGNDTVSYLNSGNASYISSGINTSTAAITVNLTSGVGIGGDAAGDHYSGIRNIEGSAFANSTLVGDNGANTLTAQGNNTTNMLMGMGAGSGTDVYDVQLGGNNTVSVGSGTNLILASSKNADHLVNANTGTTNIANIDGTAGNTTLQVKDVGNRFDLSQFSTNVSGITTLDLTSGNGTIISLGGTDVQHIGQINATTHVSTLNLRASVSELVSITSATNSYLIEVSTGDYLFYSDSSKTTQIARLHVIKV